MISITSRAYGLAPQELVNRRSERYNGASICSSMEDFVASDRLILEQVYQFLITLFRNLSAPPARDVAGPLKAVLREFQFYQLVDQVRELGLASYRARPEVALAKTIHDLRGGALTSLVGHLDALVDMADEAEVPLTLFPLVRDHMKIMRNSLSDLDYERRQRDLLPRAHSIHLIVDKWRQPAFGPTERQVEIRVHCTQEHGTLSECCVESAAIDRILYNLMNNAVRYCSGAAVDLVVVPIPENTVPTSLRFVVQNRVEQDTSAALRVFSEGGDDLRTLFSPGVSTTGSGLGLSITAEFVANAYGLSDAQEAVKAGYVGAAIQDDEFVAWFHWPLSPWRSDVNELVQEKHDLA